MSSDSLKVIRESKNGIGYSDTVTLRETKNATTKATLWKIPHKNHEPEPSLKIARYKNKWEDLESDSPKSALTLKGDELNNLMQFLNDYYEPLKIGTGKYIKADSLDNNLALQLQGVFNNKNANEIGSFLVKNSILSSDVTNIVEFCRREEALIDFEQALIEDRPEAYWQKWFEDNDWILGNEFTRIIDERDIDTKNIADHLVETFDGFVDIVELKRPNGQLKFWNTKQDHNNLIPSQDLIKAITQTQNYIQSLEEEMNSAKMLKRIGNASIVKPRATIIFGRSLDWGDEERKAFRILNDGYKDLTILTYDQVLARARKTLNLAKDR